MTNYNKLFSEFGESYLAIKNESVLGAYNSFREALDTTLLSEEMGTFIIQKCDGSESAYTVQVSSMSFMQPRACG
jgi:hypothetical protein